MVAEAHQTEGFICQKDDIRSLSLSRTFDAVLALFHVISYQTSNRDLQAVFQRATEHLEVGGLFIFDVWYAPAVLEQKPINKIKSFSSEYFEGVRIAEPHHKINENTVDVKYNFRLQNKKTGEEDVFEEVHPMRYFSVSEIDLLATGAGFQRLKVEEFFTGAKPSEQTWGVCFVLRKI